ncbi:MAG TPA: sialidase family protein [Acidimicrobiales bacterium]|nr:sialidase family protein [Acidimicrobiales bacterium]
MKFGKLRLAAAVGAMGALAAASAGSAVAQQQGQPEQLSPTAYKQVTFAPQGVSVKQLTAAAQMTKDQSAPARAFTGPTSMVADPDNPRIVVAATADLRDKQCYLSVSRDGGHTWHFSKNPPTDPTYPYCTNASASVPMTMVAWGRGGTLYYAHQAYGDGEGPREGKSSILLARTTDLGVTWKTTLVDNNRGKTGVVSNDSGVTGLTVDTSGPRDVVSVGFNQSFPDAPSDSPLKNPNVSVSTSLDGGATFGPPVDLNAFPRPSIDLAGTTHQMFMTGGFGSPFLYAHNGVLLAVTGPGFAASDTLPPAPPEAGSGVTPGTWYARPMPQLIGRSTDHGKTWTITTLGPPIYAGAGNMTGIGWTPKGAANGTFVLVYPATPATSPTTALADIVMQRSTDGGVTWSSPLAVDDDKPEDQTTSFYPQLSVAPNGRVDVAWQDNRDGVTDFTFNERYSYSTDGGLTWAPNVKINDQPINFNYGISFNSDIRQPNGVASTNQYAIIGWADTRFADEVTQTQDNFAVAAQFSPLPSTKNTVAPKIAAVFGGLMVAGVILLVIMQLRRRREGPMPATVTPRDPVSAR